MKIRTVLILTSFIIISAMTTLSAQAKKESTLANVAILNFINNTGSKNFDWLHKSLGDAVFESMRATFDFHRTDPVSANDIAKKRLTPGKEVSAGDIGYIADKTSSDIVIFGEYDYDKKTNMVLIKTKIYHVSRNEITSELANESPANNTLFQVVDRVANDIVGHITVIANEDIEKMKRFAKKKKEEEEKAAKLAKAKKPGKIALQKAEALKDFSAVYYNIAPVFGVPLGLMADGLVFGAGAGITITNTYGWFIQFGGVYNVTVFVPSGTSTLSQYGMIIQTFQGLFGLNWNIKNILFLQPYFTIGIAMENISVRILTPTGGNPPYTFKDENRVYADLIMSIGFKMPIRAGRDIFVTPFVEFSYLPQAIKASDPQQKVFMGMINFGVGVSL